MSIEYNDITIREHIGSGLNGSIYRIIWRDNAYAMKIPRKGVSIEEEYNVYMLLSSCGVRSIIPIIGTVLRDGVICLVMEEMFSTIEGSVSLSIEERIILFYHIVEAYREIIEKSDIIIGDIHPGNIFLDKKKEVRIGDLEYSYLYKEGSLCYEYLLGSILNIGLFLLNEYKDRLDMYDSGSFVNKDYAIIFLNNLMKVCD